MHSKSFNLNACLSFNGDVLGAKASKNKMSVSKNLNRYIYLNKEYDLQ